MNEPSIDRAGGPVAGVLFDMGGTLYSYESRRLMGRATTNTLRRLGFDPEAAEVADARRVAGDEVARRYAAKTSFLHADLFRDRLVRTCELLGAEVPADELERFDRENVQAIVENMPPRTDAAPTLRALGARGIHLAIVSNADESWLQPAVHRHGFDELLDGWTSSEEAASCKPDQGIFTYALAKAGLDAPAVLFVGDSRPHDIVGAHLAGMRTVFLTGPDRTAPLAAGLDADVEPDYEISDLGQLIGIVDDLNTA